MKKTDHKSDIDQRIKIAICIRKSKPLTVSMLSAMLMYGRLN